MSEWKLPWTGRCRCGATRFTVSQPPLLSMACHCTGCQRMSASAFSLSLAIPSDGFEVTVGEPVLGGLKQATRHYFCPSCSSWMFTRAEGMDWFVNIRPTMLEEHGWFVPFVETWRSEGLPWAVTGARHSFDALPEMKDFEVLTREFQANGARPGS